MSHFFETVQRFRNHLVHIAHDADIDPPENGGVAVVVDGQLGARFLDPFDKFCGSGDAAEKDQLGGNPLSGLADLALVGNNFGVHHRPRSPDGGSDPIGEVFYLFEIFDRPQPFSDSDDGFGFTDIDGSGIGLLKACKPYGKGVPISGRIDLDFYGFTDVIEQFFRRLDQGICV
ncbi:MAG: hypothetical protein C4530_12395 [Desulfobacteraceae bacterium]|nr:MAG: hypothetical protein C4530_12395 [Desulfobacteraceae bacterium]